MIPERKYEMADRLEIFLGANRKPQRLIWGDVIAWLLVLVLVLIMPFVMFFAAILMGFKKIFGNSGPQSPRGEILTKSN
jgi:hypothetical protein